MTREEFLDHYDNDNQRFRDALDELLKERAVEFGKYTVMCLRSGTDPRKSMKFPFTSAVKTDEEHLIDWYDTFIKEQ